MTTHWTILRLSAKNDELTPPNPMEYDMLPYKWDKLQIAGTQEWEEV